MATDNFVGPAESVMVPARRSVAITPDDDNDLAEVPRAISVNADGDVAFIPVDAEAGASPVVVTFKAGVDRPFRARRIMSTDTTATGIVAHY